MKQNAPKSPLTSNIPALTGLRTIVAALVFFYHWFFSYVDELPTFIGAPFKVGYVGVPVFFALSGFLITLRYRRPLANKQTSYWVYLAKRFARIFPLYLFIIIFFVAAFGRPKNMIPPTPAAWLSVITLTQALFPKWAFLGTLVGWTLTIELIYYVLAPFILRLLPAGQGVGLSAVKLLGLGLSFISLGYLLSQLSGGENSLLGQDMTWLMHHTIFGHLPDFLIGMLAALLFEQMRLKTQPASRLRLLIWGSVICAYGCMIWLGTRNPEYGSAPDRFVAFLVALFGSSLLLGMALDNEHQTLPTKLLSSRVMVYLGVVSYALYIVQLTEPIQWLYWLGLGEYAGVENRIWRGILIYFITTPIAILLYEFVEKPTTRLLNKWLKQFG